MIETCSVQYGISKPRLGFGQFMQLADWSFPIASLYTFYVNRITKFPYELRKMSLKNIVIRFFLLGYQYYFLSGSSLKT